MTTSMMDLPAELFLSSLERIYFEGVWSGNGLRWGERTAPAAALARIPILTIEGAEDRMIGPGQGEAAFARLAALGAGEAGAARRAIVAPELGHFGLIYGSGWRDHVAPRLANAFRRAALYAEAAAPKQDQRRMSAPTAPRLWRRRDRVLTEQSKRSAPAPFEDSRRQINVQACANSMPRSTATIKASPAARAIFQREYGRSPVTSPVRPLTTTR